MALGEVMLALESGAAPNKLKDAILQAALAGINDADLQGARINFQELEIQERKATAEVEQILRRLSFEKEVATHLVHRKMLTGKFR